MTHTVLHSPRPVQNLLLRLRRNHSLEHATLHVLAQRHPHTSIAGISDSVGFWIMGDVPMEEIRLAVGQALQRLRYGEKHLAIHPNCGTNLATAGILAGVAAGLVMLGSGRRLRDKLERLPMAATVVMLAMLVARPLGNLVQQHITTSADISFMEVIDVKPASFGWIFAHRIITRG